MAIQSVSYRVNSWLSCAQCLPASVIICLNEDIVVPPDCPEGGGPQPFEYHTIAGSITAVVKVSGASCVANQYYEYTIEYESEDVTVELLTAEQISGVVCTGCLTDYIDERAGDEIYVHDNEDGTSSLFSQHGCEYLFISGGELSDLTVDDTDSIDLTLAGVSPKVLTADLVVDPDPTNQLSVSPAGVFVAPQWRLLGNAGTVLGTNFLGTTDNVAFDIRVNNIRARRTIPTAGAANILDGYSGNTIGLLCVGSTIAGGGAVAQINNIATGDFNFIGAGSNNAIQVSAFGAQNACLIGAGLSNSITDGKSSSIVGGESNTIDGGGYTFIGGGISNRCAFSSVMNGEMVLVGGRNNEVLGRLSALVGGEDNSMDSTSSWSFIGGGDTNALVGSPNAVIGGGLENQISTSNYAAIVGGQTNIIGGVCLHSFIGAGLSNSNGAAKTSIVGGEGNTITAGSTHAFLGGGTSNSINASLAAALVGGNNNTIGSSCTNAFIGAGIDNILEGVNSIIVGGVSNILERADRSFIGGGENNQIIVGVGVDPDYSSILGGLENIITGGTGCTIIGGIGNSIIPLVLAPPQYSTILGGGSLAIGTNSVGFQNPADLTPPLFPSQVDVSGFAAIAYFGDVTIWVGNVTGTAAALRFYCPNTSLTYAGAEYSQFRAGVQGAGVVWDYVWPIDAPVAGDALRVLGVAGPVVTLEWAP